MTALFTDLNVPFDFARHSSIIDRVYDPETRAELEQGLSFIGRLSSLDELEARRAELQKVECWFSTWGVPLLSAAQLEEFFPNLKLVFYAAGSVQAFSPPFFERGVRVFSAFAANAVPVAEYTVGQIILAGKGAFGAMDLYKQQGSKVALAHSQQYPGNYRQTVGIIGAGAIGRLVIRLLKAYSFEVLVFDPFLPADAAAELGVRQVALDELFRRCSVISNHLANNAQTQGMLNYSLFSQMADNAVFINTGRGAQVVEADLARALEEKPARVALLDVTDPEPVAPENPFLTLPNVFLTPHIAGSMGSELARMGRYMADEYHRYATGQPPLYEVTADMLATMA